MVFGPPAYTNYNVIVGYNHSLTGSLRSVLIGEGHTISHCDDTVLIGGSALNLSYNSKATFVNPRNLTVNNSQDHAVVVGGYGNTIDGASPRAVLIGGYTNTINGDGAIIIGGQQNLIDNTGALHAVIVGGDNNTIAGAVVGGAIIGGRYNTVSADFATALGIRASATRQGQWALSSFDFLDASGPAAVADHGIHKWVGYVKTTNASPTALLVLTLEAGVAYDFMINVVGVENGGGNRAGYRRRCVIYRDGAAAAALQGSVDTIGTDEESNAAWDISVSASGNDLLVEVTGAAATDINWVGAVEWTAVGEVVN